MLSVQELVSKCDAFQEVKSALTLNNRDQLREADLFIGRNSKNKDRREGGQEGGGGGKGKESSNIK